MTGDGALRWTETDGELALFDPVAFYDEVTALTQLFLDANDDTEASAALLESHALHTYPHYARKVASAALTAFAEYLVHDAPTWRLSALHRRQQTLIFALRATTIHTHAGTDRTDNRMQNTTSAVDAGGTE